MEDKSGVSRNAISLPQGGGAATSATEGFQADLSRGTGTYSILIATPPGRGNLNPQLRLTYNSASGFGPAGLGWSYGPPSLQRRTDIGAPTYIDSEDVFTFQGEELLHVGGDQYRCRTERNFWRVTRVGDRWEVLDRDGRLYVLGETAAERLYNPADPAEVLAWMLSRLEDPNGNVIHYSYRRDQRVVTPAAGLSFQAGQLYLDRIEYNPHHSMWLHDIQLHYDFDDANGSPRVDAHLSYRAGFPLYTGWRLARIDVHVDVPGEFTGMIRRYEVSYNEDPDTRLALLNSVVVTGFDDQGHALALPPTTFGYSQLAIPSGELIRLDGAPQLDLAAGNVELVDLTGNGLPDLLSTTPGNHIFWLNNRWRPEATLPVGQRHFTSGTVMATSPNIALSQPSTHLADVRGRMAADLLNDTGMLDSPSYSASAADILARNLRWGQGRTFAVPPPFNFHDGQARTVDLTGNGRMDVLRFDGRLFRHWLNHPDGTYQDRGQSQSIPRLSFTNREWMFADLNGDGLTEIVRVENGRISYYLNRASGHRSGPLFETSPIVMGNSQTLIQGATQWDPERLIFIDLNGDGYDDAVYLYSDHIVYWFNQGGFTWSEAHTIKLTQNGQPILVTTNRPSVRTGNLLGTGNAGILWSAANSPMRYLEIAGGRKPLLLTSIDNGIGGQTKIEYISTTLANGRMWTTRVPFSIHVVKQITTTDLVTGQIEITKYRFLDGEFDRERREFLGFGVVEVEEVGDEGSADPACQTKVTITKNHLGVSASPDPVERARQRALSGLPYWRSVSGLDTTRPYQITEWVYETTLAPDFSTAGSGGVVSGTNGLSSRDQAGNLIPEPAAFALPMVELELIYDPSVSGPVVSELVTIRTQSSGGTLRTFGYRDRNSLIDPYGRQLESVEATGIELIASLGPDRELFFSIHPTAATLTLANGAGAILVVAPIEQVKRTQLTYTADYQRHLVQPIGRVLTFNAGMVIEDVRRYYDGQAFIGLPLGQIERGNLTREEVLVLREDQYQGVYGDFPGGPPDLLALGYHYQPYGAARSLGRRLVSLLSRLRSSTKQEGFGYFVNTKRFRYAVLATGAPAYGTIEASMDPNGSVTIFGSDLFYLHLTSQTDPLGNRITAQPDYRVSALTQVTDSNGHVNENQYDALGRVQAIIKPGDSSAHPTIIYEYPVLGQPLPTFITKRIRETAASANTFDSIEYHDGWSRQLQTRVEAEGGQFAVSGGVEYNARGGILGRIVPYFDNSANYASPPQNALRFRYYVDALDRELKIQDPDSTSFTLKNHGAFTVEEFDREDVTVGSPHYSTPTETLYDTRGNGVAIYQRLNATIIATSYEYNIFNKLVTVRLTGGPTDQATIRYQYDLLGRRLRTEHVDAGVSRVVFDARGKVAREADALGRVIEQVYDAAGRIFERRFLTTGEPTVTYRYCDAGSVCPPNRNLVGRLEQVTDAGGTVEFSYDPRGRLSQHLRTWDEFGILQSYTIDLSYDSADRLVRLKYPDISVGMLDSTILHRYNSGNLLDGIDLERPKVAVLPLVHDIDYDARGQRTQVEFGNGLQTDLTYDPTRFHLTTIRTHQPNGATLQDLFYCHDLEGNLTISVDRVVNVARVHTYDALYRLQEAREINTQNLSQLPEDCAALSALLRDAPATSWPFQYSPEGDVLELGDVGPLTYSHVNGRPHGRVKTGQVVYLFDDAGRLEHIETVGNSPVTLATFQYNSLGKLARVEQPGDDQIIEITYDYEGERIRKLVRKISDASIISETKYLGRWVSFHRDANTNTWQRVRQYVFDNARRVVVLDGSGTPLEYIHPDLLGSAATISDPNGQLSCTLRYEPYGRELNAAGCRPLRHRFNGKETDEETGLIDFGARHYLPALGRWISPDPMLVGAPEKMLSNPQALNAFAYAVNNPATLVDPVGKSPGKYAGEYIDTRRHFVKTVIDPNGIPVRVIYRIIEAKPGTWLSKVTHDFGWGDHYSKKEGYGAYDRNIIFPYKFPPLQEGLYHADKIKPGQYFAVQVAGAQITLIEHEGSTIKGQLPSNISKEWAWRSIGSFGLSRGRDIGIGLEEQLIEIQNKRTGESAIFNYKGGGVSKGLPVSISGASDWFEFKTRQHLTLQDFEGDALHSSASAGWQVEEFTLFSRGKEKEIIRLTGKGTALSAGVTQTYGHLEKIEE